MNDVNIKLLGSVSAGEEIGCEVLELGYFIALNGKQVQDPLSVVLSLSGKEMADW